MRRLFEATRTFLLSKRSREVAVFMFFVCISALFWFIQTLNETFEMQLDFPMQLTNVPANVVVTTNLPPTLSVTVRDKGTSLFRYETRNVVQPVVVDFDEHDDGSLYGHVILTHSEVQSQVSAVLAASTRIVTMNPDTLEYFYSRGESKRVVVVPRGHVQTDPLYYLADLTCQPDSITVWGPFDVLDTLRAVYTIPTNVTDLTGDQRKTVKLSVPRGLKLVPDEVELIADVDMYTEKTVEVPIVGTNFPAGYTLRTFPSMAQVTFRVGSKNYKNITADNFVITATYEELIALPQDAGLQLQLRSLPEGTSQVRISPSQVDFLIEKTNDE